MVRKSVPCATAAFTVNCTGKGSSVDLLPDGCGAGAYFPAVISRATIAKRLQMAEQEIPVSSPVESEALKADCKF